MRYSEPAEAAKAPGTGAGDPVQDRMGLYHGFGNALATAFEMVVVPTLFVLFGLWLDGRFGTRPVLGVVLGVLAVVGVALKTYYVYEATIEREEEGKPWRR